MERIDQINTAADLEKLPQSLRLSLRSVGQTTGGLAAYKSRAERKANIQAAVRKAVEDQHITIRLATEILQVNEAYGPKGKALIAQLQEQSK
jgi:hypothetical protein